MAGYPGPEIWQQRERKENASECVVPLLSIRLDPQDNGFLLLGRPTAMLGLLLFEVYCTPSASGNVCCWYVVQFLEQLEWVVNFKTDSF